MDQKGGETIRNDEACGKKLLSTHHTFDSGLIAFFTLKSPNTKRRVVKNSHPIKLKGE